MEFFTTLSYFNTKNGPLVFYSYPNKDLEKYVKERIARIMDQVLTEEFVTFSFDKYYSLNYYFEIDSDWARADKEALLLSAIFDEGVSMEMEKAILTICIELSDWLKSKKNIFTGFYETNSTHYQDIKSQNIIDKNLLIIKSWVEEFYNAILEAVQERVEEEDITAFIEKENILTILNYLSRGPITIENLKEWYINKYPDDNFYKLIRNLITAQMVSIPNVSKSKNPPFNVYIAEDIKTIIGLISLKNRLLKNFIENHQKESPEAIEKRAQKLQEIIESALH
ncbi:MAG: hypothetical protein HWN80_05805 [Candidatus Lokiarchaeota archaeon]|nr:hypothetical protein [Candidatus Lokiarchaeota archaeon]